MKSLSESLFDDDLVKKDVSIDFNTLKDMLFYFGRKRARLFDKEGVIYHEGRQSIYIKKFLGENDCLCFELELGVTNAYPEGTAFESPQLRVHDRWSGSALFSTNTWRTSDSDINATSHQIIKSIPNLKDQLSFMHWAGFCATEKSISVIFDLYERMINHFCSEEFEKDLIKYMTQYESKREIPGLILDILMKKLIGKK